MKEHALPQDVTGYKFHIIGNMTLKQFAEVAAGVGIGIIFYFTNLPAIIKWPLILTSSGIGALAAFVPFEERPLDHWMVALFNALYRPTQFYWKRMVKIPEPFLYESKKELQSLVKEIDLTPARRQRVKDYLHTVDTVSQPDDIEMYSNQRLNEIMSVFDQTPNVSQVGAVESALPLTPVATPVIPVATVAPPAQPEAITQPTFAPKPVDLPKPIPTLSQQMPMGSPKVSFKKDAVAQTDSNTIGSLSISQDEVPKIQVKAKPTVPDELMANQVAASLTNTGVSVPEVKQISVQKTVAPMIPRTSAQAGNQIGDTYSTNQNVNPNNPNIAVASQVAIQSKTLPFPAKPTQPNKLVGMAIDQQNIPLTGVIIEILTAQGVPARAVKTNILGQFFITTPLGNGAYTITAEKAGYTFPPQSLELTGQVMDPIEIRST